MLRKWIASIACFGLFLPAFIGFADSQNTPSTSTYDAYKNVRNNPHVLNHHAPDRILVKFKEGTRRSSIESLHTEFRSEKVKEFKVVKNLHLVRLAPGRSVQETIDAYRNDPNVLYAEPGYEVKAFALPNDPSFGFLWGLQNVGQSGGTPGADIDAVRAWDMTTGSRNVVAAVIDTGVDYTHSDFAANMWRTAISGGC